ncbi:MAG: protease complex subunit PrcB family protein [Acidobacteria bacterium]|jgi:hypothetical protein|nr:MAG: protease complex subunit PrcB family protein [Acidobacteriota bacterium]GIU81860.1 MAG: hypothetical protein KatS3mg006_0924 [Pyrinomonadaceae bacterium]
MRVFAGIIMLISLLLSGITAVEAQKRKNEKKSVKKMDRTSDQSSQFRVVLEGDYSGIEEPFIFVARDIETYNLLKELGIDLPSASKFNFPYVGIVAIFAGTRPTPGYKIQVSQKNGAVAISVVSPPPNAILPQVLTSPYKIVAIPVDEEKPLPVEVPSSWKMETYRISRGNIGYSGGFAPREKNFDVDGKINVFRLRGFEGLVTLSFSLTAKSDVEIKMFETASGKIEGGKVKLNWVDPGNFSEFPRPSMKASGVLLQNRITLKFEPNPTNVADGFEAYGEIEAVKSRN